MKEEKQVELTKHAREADCKAVMAKIESDPQVLDAYCKTGDEATLEHAKDLKWIRDRQANHVCG